MIYLGLNGYKIFINSGYSPTGSMRPVLSVLFPLAYPSELTTLWADAASCYKLLPRRKIIKFTEDVRFLSELDWFVVEFWDGRNARNADAVLSIGVYAPSHWDADYFLTIMHEDAKKHGAITVSKSCIIHGISYPFHIINTMHHNYINI
jgi:hypothetical protein